jgi:chorismate synthase
MLGCHIGRMFQVTVAGGSYQEGLTSVVHGVPPGMELTEQEVYGDLLLRKPGADELSSPRKEPDLPVIYNGPVTSPICCRSLRSMGVGGCSARNRRILKPV